MAKKKSKSPSCMPTYIVSESGKLLKLAADSTAGSVLSVQGKKEKKLRKKRGCLNGTGGTFKLTDKQKKYLPKVLQKAIIAYHRKQGKRIIE